MVCEDVKKAIAYQLVKENKTKLVLYIIILVFSIFAYAFKALTIVSAVAAMVLAADTKKKIDYLVNKHNIR